MSVTPFLQQVAKRTLELDPQKTIVLLPNRRAGIFLKRAIGECIDQPRFLPQIMTIEDFFMQLSGLIKIEQVEQLFRLYESHRVCHDEPDSFENFLGWGPTFLADCGEIDTNLIDAESFFNTLYFDKEIRNWNLTDQSTEMQKNYLAFWERAKHLYFHFTDALLQDGRAYNGLAYRIAIQQIEQAFPKNQFLVFAGFNALNRAEEELFDYVYQNQLGEFLWDFDSYYVDDDENKAGLYFKNRYRPKWPKDKQLQSSPKKIGQQTERIEIIEAPNLVSQCEIAAKLVTDLAQQGLFHEKTAIVLADEQLLQPLLYQLPKNLGLYNITMGKSVSQFPIYHLFSDYFKLQKSVIGQANVKGYPMALVKPLLLSPFLQSTSNGATSQLYEYLLENNVSFLKTSEIDAQLPKENLLYQMLRPVNHVDEMIAFSHELIEILRVQLHHADSGLVRQVLFEIKKILQQFTSFETNLSVSLGLAGFYNLFRQVAQSTKIPYEGEPLAGLQIMGVLETRCLDFENIILLSANEGILPQGRSANSFIPYIFKKKFEIQTFQDKDAIYAYSIYRLFHTVKNFHFVYNGQAGAMGGGELSRFAKQIEAEFPKKVKRKVPIINRAASYENHNRQNEDYRIEKTPEIIGEIHHYLENVGLSPSALKQLINSPLDFYFQRIAKVKEPKTFEKDIELSTFGNIVHNSLEELYTPFIGKKLDAARLEEIQKNVAAEVDKQVKAEFKMGDAEHGKNFLYKNAANTLVKQTIALDQKRCQQNEITIISLEEELVCNIPMQVAGQDILLKLHGKADRIQQRNDLIEIIDYKTGKVLTNQLRSNQIHHISVNPKLEKLNQLLCYITMAHYGKGNYALAEITAAMQPLKSWEQGLCFINGNEDYTLSEEELSEYLQQIQIAIANLIDPAIPFTPEKDVESRLRFSQYKSIYL